MTTEEKTCIRCPWVTEDPLYIKYHDEEWGKPERDNFRLFEMLCLEGQQAGLSWITILKKRENYRTFFFNFDPYKILTLTESDLNKILLEKGVVRHKGKLESIKNNAKCYIDMEKNGEDFSNFIWSFVNHKPMVNNWTHSNEIPTETKTSLALANALKKRSFKFVGNTVCYAFMQACGLVNDHVGSCISKTESVLTTD
ncbi:unnamed protein product [Arctia plantaginis]|uniref:DNA-3-methyladenine glycosylase I n=1 Tax=Arctia plantaginis TaxID=874455 RepID=A0A8S1B9H3_ARCPL|nr:unnamed protein product [Arctia plantaginis]CAB3255518.1 unnamed protein product [Arctia plantaginis]